MSERIEAMGENVILIRDPVDEMSSGGLALPPSVVQESKPMTGVVQSVGQGILMPSGQRVPIDNVKPGDRVLFRGYATTQVKGSGRELLTLSYHELLAVLEKEEESCQQN